MNIDSTTLGSADWMKWVVARVMVAMLCFSVLPLASAQDKKQQLADAYFGQGEYEKASTLYQKLLESNPRNAHAFNRYVDALVQLDEPDKALKMIDDRIKTQGNTPQMIIKKGELLTNSGRSEEADALFDLTIDQLKADGTHVNQLATAFHKARRYEQAIKTYERGADLLGNPTIYALQLRNLAQYVNDKKRIVQYALMVLASRPDQLNTTKSIFSRYLQDEDQAMLQTEIYKYLQKYQDSDAFPELLIWSFLAQDDFASALRQAKSLDRKFDENGSRIYMLAQSAINHKQYDTAIKALQYILDEKSRNSTYYPIAKADILRCRRQKILNEGGGVEELKALIPEYDAYFAEEGKNAANAYVLMSYARFTNTFLQDVDKSIELFEELLSIPGVKAPMPDQAKLELGDLYLLRGDRWEATLRYAQVDKDHPEAEIGQDARYRNALLSYYVGDFEWAQEQFDILKASTSKVISNDAIDRSVFITANLGLDSTELPLRSFARSELYIFQRRYESAMKELEELLAGYPDHELEDDIYYLKANAYRDQRQWDLARDYYLLVARDHGDDIRADNSIYALAELYQEQYDDPLTSAKLYEKLFLEFKDSTFAITARKRYRALVAEHTTEKIDAEGKTIEQLTEEEKFMRGMTN